ncbi:MAG: NAD(P)/FAD-dependent oxidoreductase [Bacillales bacterium]|nr:NAD(P)/FAD-dependent oxidoreductase [Bacillales bacterium]
MRIGIIGSGPSGLMCAIEAAKKGHEVFILEKNEKAGKKIYITGKGRCNVTNACSTNEFINNVVHNGRFLYSSINAFSSQDTISFFESHGVPLVIERGNRVFPQSYHASDITKALVDECKKYGTRIYYHVKITSIKKEDDIFIVSYNGVNLLVDKLVVATGGLSYPSTGSTGDGYAIATQFGHTIIDTKPALCLLKVKDQVSYDAKGLTLKNVALYAYNDHFNKFFKGEMMFGPGYIDGPIVLSMSSLVNEEKVLRLYIDLKMGLTHEQLDARLVRDFSENPNKTLKEELMKLLPIQMISDFLKRVNIPSNFKVGLIKKEQREKIVQYLKRYDLEYMGLGDYNRAIITKGGVSTKEINPKTFESKITSNLYFIGEVLDVDAFTGGFNMQIALSSGYSCGFNI